MAIDLGELEHRIKILEDTEAIKKLKAKYWRCIDRKLWNELSECITEDVMVNYGPDMQFQGKKAVLEFFRKVLGNTSVITVHAGYAPEIEIRSDTSANGIWSFNDRVITQPASSMKGWAHYEDVYQKENGDWRIKFTRISRVLQETTTTAGQASRR